MDRFIIAIILISAFFIFVTYLLNRFYSGKRFVKYIPSIISLILSIMNLLMARFVKGEGFRDLARILVAVFLFAGFSSGLLSALYFDFVSPSYKKRR